MEFRTGSPVSMDGPLAPFATDLRRVLAGGGYSLRPAGELVRLPAQLSRWLDSRGLTADDLTSAVAGEFFQARRADGCRKWLTSRSLAPLLECLQIAPADTVGGIPAAGRICAGRADRRADHRVRHGLVPAAQREPGQDDGHRAAVATAFPARQRTPEDLAPRRGALGAGMAEGPPAAAA